MAKRLNMSVFAAGCAVRTCENTDALLAKRKLARLYPEAKRYLALAESASFLRQFAFACVAAS